MRTNRRDLLRTCGAASGYALLSPLTRTPARGQWPADPHFFINLMFEGGWDPFYLFNSRPRSLTDAGKVQNYFSQPEHAVPWTDPGGNSALVAHYVDRKLGPLRGRFSVVNGIIMSTSFDGHDQNMNEFLTGNAFGGPFFLPLINRHRNAPLDFIREGNPFGIQITNQANSLPVSPNAVSDLAALAGQILLSPRMKAADMLAKAQFSRLAALRPQGMLSLAAAGTSAAFDASDALAGKIRRLETRPGDPGDGDDDFASLLHTILAVFSRQMSWGALIFTDPPPGFVFDTHGVEDARKQEELYSAVTDRIASLFNILAATPYDEGRGVSFLDVTTVVISSEFGRPMRQQQKPIDATGTDHNPLGNSAVIGGKRIKGGLIIGATDAATIDAKGAFTDISAAHRALDRDLTKTMGRPFDFRSGKPVSDLPGKFAPDSYITAASLVNTLMAAGGAGTVNFRKAGTATGSPTAPVVRQLLQT